MKAADFITTISYGVGILGISGFVFSFLRYSNYRETVKLQNDNIKALEEKATILANKAKDNEATINNLQGQLNAYKEVPLKSIADSFKQIEKENLRKMEALNQVLETQNIILQKLSK